MGNTKAIINLKEGIIELEGSEEFVRSYLDEFKIMLNTPEKVKTSVDKKGSGDKGARNEESREKKKGTTKKTVPKISAERFEIHGNNNIPALSDFMNEKKPGTSNGNIIAVVGYYITELLGNETFSEGQLEYAYKMLKLTRPKHLHQIMINEKNRNDYYEPDSENNTLWRLTRTGEIFVSDQLPGSE